MLYAIPSLIALVWFALLVVTRREMRLMPKLRGVLPTDTARPRVLAVVPARDEAEVVDWCIKALLIQQGVELHVLLYDDRSTDQTAELADALAEANKDRLTVIHGAHEPPEGWCGKPHALTRALELFGYNVATGTLLRRDPPDYLLFVDADVVLRPTAVAEMAQLIHAKRAGLASALPHLICKTFWEKVAGPSIGALITARHKPSSVNRVNNAAVLANGQFMMLTPEAYARVGGHAGVRKEVLEDVALARNIKQSGIPVVLADGQKVVATRMYSSLAELFQGWVKNAFPLVGGTVRQAVTYALLALWLSWTPLACLMASIPAWINEDVGLALVLSCGWLIPLMVQMRLRKVGGQSPLYAFFAPVGAIIVAAVLGKATWKATRGSPVTWKGRSYVDGTGVQK